MQILSKESIQLNVPFIGVIENIVNIVMNLHVLSEYRLIWLFVLFFQNLIETRCTGWQGGRCNLRFSQLCFRISWLYRFGLFLL